MTDAGPKPAEIPASWRELLAPLRRTAWRPRVESGERELRSSGYGGIAAMFKGERWPRCGECGKPLELLVQLSPAELPEGPLPEWLRFRFVQLFLCTTGMDTDARPCGTHDPQSATSRVRVLPYADYSPDPERARVLPVQCFEAFEDSPVEEPIWPLRIVGWEAFDDYPNWEELEAMGIRLPEDPAAPARDACASGDKLAGWPAWVQAPSYPYCPECGAVMLPIFQIGEEGLLPEELQVMGTGYVFTCPNRQHSATFRAQRT